MGFLIGLIFVGVIAWFMIVGIFSIVSFGNAPKAEQKRQAWLAENGAAKMDEIFTGAPQVTWLGTVVGKVRIEDVVAGAGERGYTLTASVPQGKDGVYTRHIFTRTN